MEELRIRVRQSDRADGREMGMEGNGSVEDGVALRPVANGVAECEIDAVEDATRGNGDAEDKGRVTCATILVACLDEGRRCLGGDQLYLDPPLRKLSQ
ncbi:hypothetical protein Pmani_038628 [Petrolisthes manimaculis]|uniref:Uncharacterized protein n=1 Tax=Petrolisthes manimaculis TaxID=1843537 RepID=A0AAE1NGI7_9EUCA|nr:hypothetical protein Pmani_038628 [Petrolisthes manimaculis]